MGKSNKISGFYLKLNYFLIHFQWSLIMLWLHKKRWTSCRPREHGKRGEHLPSNVLPSNVSFFWWLHKKTLELNVLPSNVLPSNVSFFGWLHKNRWVQRLAVQRLAVQRLFSWLHKPTARRPTFCRPTARRWISNPFDIQRLPSNVFLQFSKLVFL
jgi:hypothetical protein